MTTARKCYAALIVLLLSISIEAAEVIPFGAGSGGVLRARIDSASIRTPDALVIAGTTTQQPPPTTVIRGSVIERPDCAVTGTRRPNGGLAAMVICQDGWALKINPDTQAAESEAVLPLNVAPKTGCAATGRCVVNIIADTDHQFVTSNGGTVEGAVAAIDTLVAQANARYEFDFGITFRVFRYRIRMPGEADPFPVMNLNDANATERALVSAITAAWVNEPEWQRGDLGLVHLFLGRPWTNSGLSDIPALCRVRSQYSAGSNSLSGARLSVFMHEVGHGFGAHHLNASIMQTGGHPSPFAPWGSAAAEIAPARAGHCVLSNARPVASAVVACRDNRTCSFDGRASLDEEPLRFEWNFGDGRTSTASHGDVTYATSGQFTVTLTVTDSVGQQHTVATQAAASVFTDVPADHWARQSIEAIEAAGITSGCGTAPRRFCPDGLMPRWQMAVFLLRAIDPVAVPPACTGTMFADVNCATTPAAAWIEELAREGIDTGCATPGHFCPDDRMTRALLAPVLLRARMGGSYVPPVRACPPLPFSDVPCLHPQRTWIDDLRVRGITAGCGNGMYCPANEVNRASMAVFLSRAFGLPGN